MENQGKRLLLAVGLALGVILVWNMVFAPEKKEPPPKDPNAPVLVKATSTVGLSLENPAAQLPEPGPENTITLDFPGRFTATFSDRIGGPVSWKLADARYEKDQTRGELLPSVPGTGAFQVDFAKSTYVLPKNLTWQGTKVSDTQVRYTASTSRRRSRSTRTSSSCGWT
jgi:hypothetical protein